MGMSDEEFVAECRRRFDKCVNRLEFGDRLEFESSQSDSGRRQVDISTSDECMCLEVVNLPSRSQVSITLSCEMDDSVTSFNVGTQRFAFALQSLIKALGYEQ